MYSPEMITSFINGEWVNLNQHRVYQDYDIDLNGTDRTVQPNDILHIGIDFNVRRMGTVVSVIENGECKVVDEFFGSNNTESLIRDIKKRYPKHKIVVYPDSSGIADKTSAAANSSDIAQLRTAFGNRFVKHHNKNPLISTRLNAVNSMICNADGLRRLKVNSKTAPLTAEALENQCYKNGKPDKSYKYDDINDALGYLVFFLFAKKRPSLRTY